MPASPDTQPLIALAAALAADAAVPAILWLAFSHPAGFAVALVAALVVSVLLTLLLLRFLKSLVRGLRGRLGGATTAA